MTEPSSTVTKDELVARIREGHAALEQLLGRLDPVRLEEPGVYGELSVKDVIAHLSAWETMEVGWLRDSLDGKPVVRFTPEYRLGDEYDEAVMHALNEHIFLESKDKSFDEVLARLHAGQTAILGVVDGMSEADLNNTSFSWWEVEPIWTSIAGNTYEHYTEHVDLIEEWLASRGEEERANGGD